MVTAHGDLVSEEEFLAGPETKQQVELLDGEVIEAPAPTFRHQWIQGELFLAMKLWERAQEPGRFTVVQSPSDVRFTKNRILQPDIFVVEGRIPLELKGPIRTVPFLCIEIVSDRAYDRVTKRMVYAKAGVAEYWLVEQEGLVERRTGPDLDDAEEITTTLTSPRLPGFTFDLAKLAGRDER